MTGSILDGALDRRPFDAVGGQMGAAFETAVLADGRRVVIKHVSPDDWIVRLFRGDYFLHRLWAQGVFSRVPDAIDHAMLAVEPSGAGWVIVMRDVSAHILAEDRVLSRAENRRALEAMDAMHRAFDGLNVDGVPLYDHYAAITPKRIIEAGQGTPVAELMLRGWELFPDLAPADVVDPVQRILDDPAPFVDELAKHPQTFVHGDMRLHNMGLTGDRLVLLDWEVAGPAPAAIEFAWYLIISASRIAATREQVIEDYAAVAGDRFDPRAWDLACIGAVIWLGWNKAVDIVDGSDPELQAQERTDLDWWIGRLRRAFETWSPA